MRCSVILCVVVFSTACTVFVNGRTGESGCEVTFSSAKLQAAARWLDELVEDKLLPGGVLRFQLATGERWTHVAGNVFSENTIFRICSMTKPIVAAAILQLAEQGKLALSDPVDIYLPEFRNMNVLKECDSNQPQSVECNNGYSLVPSNVTMTLRHLIQHTSGLSYDFFGLLGIPKFAEVAKYHRKAGVPEAGGCFGSQGSLDEMVSSLAKVPLMHEPGTHQTYSTGVDVLGKVIEIISGVSLGQYLQDNIFQPLGMTDTTFRIPRSKQARLARIYYRREDMGFAYEGDRVLKNNVDASETIQKFSAAATESKLESGGCGLLSTVDDYAKFVDMLAKRGRGGRGDRHIEGSAHGSRILAPYTMDMFFRDSLPSDIVPLGTSHGAALQTEGYGMGVHISRKDAPHRFIYHAGALATYMFVDRQLGLSGVLMTQCSLLHGCTDAASIAHPAVSTLAYSAMDESCMKFAEDRHTFGDPALDIPIDVDVPEYPEHADDPAFAHERYIP